MEINWEKRGLIYCPDGSGFFKTHATRPVPYRLDEGTLRLFYSSRDSDDRMLPTYIDVEVGDPSKILNVPDRPLVALGEPGAFDDSGATLAAVVDDGDRALVYYTGWKRRRVVSFELSVGLLVWDRKGDTFERLFRGPTMPQDRHNPLLVAGPFVVREGGRWRAWYCSGTGWRFPGGNPEPLYTVFYAESADGIDWEPPRGPVIPYKFDGEVVSAPWVERVGERYLMWYSTRGHETREAKSYTVGFAESADGITWERRDERAGINRSEEGWDSEMVCYPSLYPYGDRVYMFYSGNGVGRGGIGYAVAENFLGR
jgi:hypothetical protein